MKKEDFGICEIFPTVQGEGRFVGEPCILIRFNGCNLFCPFCDTKYALKNTTTQATKINDSFNVFNKQIAKNLFEIIEDNINDEIKNKNKLSNLQTIMLTGGEPLLYSNIINIIQSKRPWTKFLIETNGTLLSNIPFLAYNIDHFTEKFHLTISPKLNPMCYSEINNLTLIIDQFRATQKIQKKLHEIIDYKFIYSDTFDHGPIIEFVTELQIPPNHRFAMPLTPNMNEQNSLQKFKENCKRTINFCLQNNFRFSPREHIWLFDPENREEKLNLGD